MLNTKAQQSAMFYSAAIFNWLACVMFFPGSGISSALGFTPLMTNGPFEQVALMAIGLFGIGYWMAARDFAANRGIVVLGAIGKVCVVAIFFGHYLMVGDVNLAQALPTLGDAAYVILFLLALNAQSREKGAPRKV
jgi:hypothetical protein